MRGNVLLKTVCGVLLLLLVLFASCRERDAVTPPPPQNSNLIVADSVLFRVVTQSQPFSAYTLFPNADSVTSGTLNGSTAHQPLVRVSMNTKAFGALQSGRLPAGGKFPEGSIIFKEIRTNNGLASLYAVIYKESINPLANSGWLWAEYSPNGAVVFSITSRGSGCVGCHSREQGPQNDFVRTFERQR